MTDPVVVDTMRAAITQALAGDNIGASAEVVAAQLDEAGMRAAVGFLLGALCSVIRGWACARNESPEDLWQQISLYYERQRS